MRVPNGAIGGAARRGRDMFLVGLLCLPGAGPHAQEVKVSGQLNRLLLAVDDGTGSRGIHSDNVNSQTRLRITFAHDLAPSLKMGANWESGYTENPSSLVSMTDASVKATANKRHADIYLAGRWGRASMGRGDGAANGGMESDLSGTTVISYSGITDIGGGFAFRNDAAIGPTIAATIGNLDFESRYHRLRYDAPALGPLTLAASEGRKDGHRVSELALWHTGEPGAGKLAAALGWSRERKGGVAGDEDTGGGSVSWLAPSGVNLSVSASRSADQTPGKPAKRFLYGKLGHLRGMHAVSIDYALGRDFRAVGDRSRMLGVGYVYTATTWMELYAGAKRHRLDCAGCNYDDIVFLAIGARLKF